MTELLIIGGSRFLGRAVAESFRSYGGFRVTVMNRGTRPPVPGVDESIVCDKNDRAAFSEVLRARYWDVVVDTMLQPEELEFVIQSAGDRIGHFIHVGSIGVYGDARLLPAPEWLPMAVTDNVESVIFTDKLQQDQTLMRAFMEKRFPVSILRMSMIYGRGAVPLDGVGDRMPEYFQALAAGKAVELAGDGTALLQPGHVRDLARAFPLCAVRSETIGQIYNICGSHAMMLRDYVRQCAAALNAPQPRFVLRSVPELRERCPERSLTGIRFVTQHMCAAIDKARRDLDWRPEIPLHAGLADNFAWMRENGKL